MKKELLIGGKFGRLTIISEMKVQGIKHLMYRCLCDCGEEGIFRAAKLRIGHTRSCGCLKSERYQGGHQHTIGYKRSRTYNSWVSMRTRCYDEKDVKYKYYGARDVRVCERWRTSFDAFLEDMGVRPDGKTLDRIDVTGNYEPGNCRWATPLEQAHNKRPKCNLARGMH